MRSLNRLIGILTSSLATLGLAGCLGGGSSSSSSQASLGEVAFTSLELLTYDQLTATMKIKGALNIPGATSLNSVTLYTDSLCELSSVGRGLAQDLAGGGIEIQISSTAITRIYLKTNTVSDCFYMTEHLPHYEAPPAPTFLSTSPTSPTRATNQPLVLGNASAATTLVRLYDDAACSNLVGSGSPQTFSTVGLIANLQPDTTNTVYVVAIDAFGKSSTCALLTNFIHSSVGASLPVFASMTPVSPSSTVLNPVIVGTVGTDSATVGVYSDAACSVPVKIGTADEFRTTGLELLVTENSTTNFYGMSVDTNGLASDCVFLTIYVHDAVVPTAPTFISALPASPTRTTLVPRVKGTASADTAMVRLYNNPGCTTQTGAGTKAVFEGTGISTAVQPNTITSIYAANIDAAGNMSACTLMTTYINDTIPPEAPVFGATVPASPNNQSITPFVQGNVDVSTVSVELFKDDVCSQMVGSGSASVFPDPGIQVSLTGNATTTVYAHSIDEAGNVSDCAALTNYAHSTQPASPPGFFQTVPASPSRVSYTPYIVGTASNTVARVTLYGDNVCTIMLGTATKSNFVTIGIQATVPQNVQTSIYAISQDVYGNVSNCTFLTNYIHDTIVPFDPVFTSLSPLSPNNQSITPVIKGSITVDPSNVLPVTTVNLYDSFLCLNRIGTGTPAGLAGAGIQASVGQNTETSIYARSFDAAGNMSNCTLFANYTHDALIPGQPVLASISPMTPSYTSETKLIATIGPTTDFLLPTSVVIYTDATCSTVLTSGTPTALASPGFDVNVTKNTTTNLYAATFNVVGTASACTKLIDYKHSDIGPVGLYSNQIPDGSVSINWTPDSTASPIPTYTVRRAIISGGPYTTIASGVNGTSYRDSNVSNGATYYYVVAATNNTGSSKNSAENAITVSVSVPAGPIGLSASPGPAQATLNWSGYSSTMTYKILRASQSGGPYTTIVAKQISTSYIDTGLTNGTPYYYVIEATNPAGDSVQSNEASVVPLGVPSAPTNLSISPVLSTPACAGGSGVVLSWTAPSYYTTFVISRSGSSGSTSPYASTGGTTYVDCYPSYYNSPNYNYYTVSASWGPLNSPNSNEVAFVNDSAPVLKANPGNSKVVLSWPTVTYATKYKLLRSTQSGGPYTILNSSVATNSYTDSTAVNGQAYFYVAYAEYITGIFGWPSLEVGASPGTNPGAPSNLTVIASPAKTPTLTWTAPEAFNSFNIYRAAAIGGPYTYLAQSTTTTFTDSSPLVALSYYKVTASWGSFETAGSNVVFFRNGVPSFVTITASTTDISLSWTAISGVMGYSVMRSVNSGGPYTTIATPTTNSYVDSAVASNIGYFYVVRADFADGTSAPTTNEVSGMLTTSAGPAGLTVTSTSTSNVGLTWAKVTGATTYRLYRATSGAGPFTLAQTTSATTSTVAGLISQTNYYFRVTSVKSGIESSPSNVVQATTRSAPSAPQVTAGTNLVTVAWGTVINALTYEVTRSTDGIAFTSLVSGLSVTTYNDNTAVNGTLYFYRIIAHFASDTLESSNSSGVTPGVVPRVPAGLSVTSNKTGTDIDLAWSPVPGATTYKVYVATSSGGPYSLSTQTANFSGITISSLTSGTRYYFVATAITGAVESATSSEVSVIPLATPNAPIATMSGANISLSWSAIAGATTYTIWRSTDQTNYSTLTTGVATNSYSDTTAANGLTYTYKYQPVDGLAIAMSVSQPSATITPGASPEVPQNLTAASSGTTSIALSWISVPNAITYTLYRSTVAGGPYSQVAIITSPTTTYNNTGLSAGGTYFYVVTADTSSPVHSAYSNEASVTLAAAPSSLVATAQTNQIQLSWSAAGGASSYRIMRGQTSGGPYGLIGTSAVTAFSDTTAMNAVTYYYMVTAVVSGAISRGSNEASAVGIRAMSLQVPIELTDQGMGSDVSATTFERTRTSLNTTNYDGSPTYFFEIVAQNSELSSKNVVLVDNAGSTVATATIPAATYAPLRIRVSMTPTAGSNTYRVRTPATPTPGTVEVFTARMFVNQMNATKTKIYIPLLSSASGVYSADTEGFVESSNSSSFSELSSASIFQRDTSKLSTLAAQNAWELEAIVSASGSATGSVGFIDTTTSSLVAGTESVFTNTAPMLVRSPLSEGAIGFDSSTELHNYQVSIRCAQYCTSGGGRLYKAGLWVRLTAMDKVRVYFRNSLGANVLSTLVPETERTYMDLSLFSNPTAYFQRVGFLQSGTSPTTIELLDLQLLDTDTVGATPVVDSSTVEINNSKNIVRSPALTLTNGHRYAPQITPTGATYIHVDSAIIVDAVR
jgi:fibronectin type 3 domain-containing protein